MSSGQTILQLTNGANQTVHVYLTLGATPGCVQDVSQIPFITTVVNKLQGWFALAPGASVQYTSPQGVGINGNFAFGTPPLNCPTSDYPNGVSLAEFILNNSFQGSLAQETIDISAVAGVNALTTFSMSGGGQWDAGPIANVIEFTNKPLGSNTGLVGVFPCGCDNCTEKTDPPCPNGHPPYEDCQSEPICNVTRPAGTSGGTVTITFKGFV